MADFFSTLSEAVTSAGRCMGDGLSWRKLTKVTKAPWETNSARAEYTAAMLAKIVAICYEKIKKYCY